MAPPSAFYLVISLSSFLGLLSAGIVVISDGRVSPWYFLFLEACFNLSVTGFFFKTPFPFF